MHAALPLRDAECVLVENFLPPRAADALFAALRAKIHWRQHQISVYGRECATPRLSAWYGERGAVYAYSNIVHAPLPWLDELRELKARLERETAARFNAVLANLYRHGGDGMGWHSDDEAELGRRPVIASVSLGETRRFLMRHKRDKTLPTQKIDLAHGSLLIMRGETQQHWRHALAKTRRNARERINLTYRRVFLSSA